YAPGVEVLQCLEVTEGAVLFGPSFDIENLASTVARDLDGLGATFDPFDRTAAEPGRRPHPGVLRVGADLAAEATTHVRRDDAQLALGKPQAGDQQDLDQVRVRARH